MIGVDIVEIARIEKALKLQGFLTRMFTEAEREYLMERGFPSQTVAGMFCAKEAVAKALGTGLSHGVAICDIEVLHNEDNMPAIHLYHGAAARAEELGLGEIQVSISHEKNYAVAVCLGIKKSGRKKKAEPRPL